MQVNVKTNIAAVLARMDNYKRDVLTKAIPRALNRTGEQARTTASREVRDLGYNFSASEIKSAIRISKASSGRLKVTMYVRRQAKSLMLYGAKQTKDGVSVKVHGQRKTIKGAFIAQLRNGVQGVFIEDKAAGKVVLRHSKQYKRGSRGGWMSVPARRLYGPSVGGVYGTDRVQTIMRKAIADLFEARLAHEIKYLSR
jgi:hypothetical protein